MLGHCPPMWKSPSPFLVQYSVPGCPSLHLGNSLLCLASDILPSSTIDPLHQNTVVTGLQRKKKTSLQTSTGENGEKNSEAGKTTKQNHGKENRHVCFPPCTHHTHTHADEDKSKYNSNQNVCQQINLVN